jgi:hypothetical protein|tara:strand:+ start:1863 stop:2135 length:273 start_codon:yes stop_codon:yes gene_type:complete
MSRYPELPQFKSYSDEELMDMYYTIQSFASNLSLELDTRDSQINQKIADRVLAVTSTGDIGGPTAGDIAYSKESDTFRGFTVASGWVDLH